MNDPGVRKMLKELREDTEKWFKEMDKQAKCFYKKGKWCTYGFFCFLQKEVLGKNECIKEYVI